MKSQIDFISIFADCGQCVADAIRGVAPATLRSSTGSIGAGGDNTLRVDQIAEFAALSYLENMSLQANILSEEVGFLDKDAEITIIIDPIDQTINASRGLPYYSFSIAAYQDGDVISGFVRNLASGDIFYATRGGGAFMNAQPIKVSQCKSLEEAYCFVIRSPQGEALPRYQNLFFATKLLRVTGCSSLDICYVASGQWDACVHADLSKDHGEKIVDVASAKLILEEAGGIVRDINGHEFPLALDLTDKHPIIATATTELMGEILNILHKVS